MEHSMSSLVYKGSISEAISEARRLKKLFVVYISGDNAESRQLEELTWMNENVAESVSKYCILLHISEGSVDAANFSAICYCVYLQMKCVLASACTDPQKSAPCITAIGFNGVQLWQNEGFVDAEVLSSSLEKVWLSLHIQETTATFLTAALASQKSEPQNTFGADAASFEQGSSSNIIIPSPSTDEHIVDSESRAAASSLVDNTGFDNGDKVQSKQNGESSGSVSAEVKSPISSTESAKELLSPVKVNTDNSGDFQISSGATDQCPASEVCLNVVGRHLEVSTVPSGVISSKATESVEVKSSEVVEDKIDSGVPTEISQLTTNKSTEREKGKEADDVEEGKRVVLDSSSSKSTDVYLNIRLHDGATLQEKFVLASTLRLVKDYVDRNITSSVGSYDLAIPYPRKVFSDQDLNNTLSDLGLSGRQALIVVPHRRPTGNYKGESSPRSRTIGSTNSVSPNNEGYFTYVRRLLSYVNPFSYLGGAASSSNSANETQSQSGMWQYNPNPALQNNLRGPNPSSPPPTTTATGGNNSKNKRPASYRFGSGSNIHTLKHDEDDPRFNDKNTFWNGNSTEYGGGGDNDRK